MEEWIRGGGLKRVDAFGKPDDAFLGVVRHYGHWRMLKGGFGG